MNRIIQAIIFFSLIKLSLFLANLPLNYVALWRTGNVNVLPVVCKLLMFVLIGFVLFLSGREFNKSTSSLQNKTLLSIAFIWFFQALFTNRPFLDYNYLYFLDKGMLYGDVFLDHFVVDMFFDRPFSVFWAIFLLFSYVVLNNFKLNRYLIYLFILPFLHLNYMFNDLNVIFTIATSTVAIFAMLCKNKFCSAKYPNMLLITSFVSVSYYYYNSNVNNKDFWLHFYVSAFVFIFTLIFTKMCEKNNAHALSWISFAFTPLFLSHVVFGLHSRFSLYSVWLYSFASLGNIAFVVLCLSMLAGIAGLAVPCLKNRLFSLSVVLTGLIYVTDGVMFYVSKLKIGKETLYWLANMNNIWVTFKTGMSFVPIQILISIVLIFISFIWFSKKSTDFIIKNPALKNVLFGAFLMSQILSGLVHARTHLPLILKDPFIEVLAIFDFSDKNTETVSFDELEQGFKNSGIVLVKHEPRTATSSAEEKFNLIYVTLESVHWRYLNMFNDPVTWPEMSKYKNRMTIFPNFYSNFPESSNGDFSCVTGLYTANEMYLQKINAYTQPTMVEELKNNDYYCAYISSGSVVDGNAIALINSRPFDLIYDLSNMPGVTKQDCWMWGVIESKTIEVIINEIQGKKIQEPFFIWYRTLYPHAPFPDLSGNTLTAEQMLADTQVAPYKEALKYLDKQLAELVNKIDGMSLNKKTIIALVSDHGEMLGEIGPRGHGLYVTPDLTNVPFILIHPYEQGFKINRSTGSQVDVLPTLLDYMNIESSCKRYSQGQSLISYDYTRRPVYISSISAYGIVENDYYFEFPDKNMPECNVYKITEGVDNKAVYTKVEGWASEDIKEKHAGVARFYKLQRMFLNKL